MAGKSEQPLNHYTCRFRPSSLKYTDKSGLDGLQAGKQWVIKAAYPPHADRRKMTFHSGGNRHFLVGVDIAKLREITKQKNRQEQAAVKNTDWRCHTNLERGNAGTVFVGMEFKEK